MLLRSGAPEWIIAFLGNPGEKYAATRHNMGFRVADEMEERYGKPINRLRFRALSCQCRIAGKSVFLMKPQTFMNLSGEAVGPAAAFYKIPPERVLAVFDDVAIAPGKIRVRRGGSAGGHNGVKSLIAHLGGDGFPRVKVGVGSPPHPEFDMVDWVIGKIPEADSHLIGEAVAKAADAIDEILKNGLDSAMNKFN